MSNYRRLNDPEYLQLHITGDSHVKDVSGHGNHGTWSGTAAYADGPFNGRSVMDCDNGYASVTMPGTFIDCTVALHVKPLTVTGNGGVFEAGSYASAGMEISRIGATGYYWYVNNATPIITPAGAAVALAWEHLTLTISSNTVTAYRNGLQVGTGTKAGAVVMTPFTLPRSALLDFHIANVRIYNVALTGDEVAYLHNITNFGG